MRTILTYNKNGLTIKAVIDYILTESELNKLCQHNNVTYLKHIYKSN